MMMRFSSFFLFSVLVLSFAFPSLCQAQSQAASKVFKAKARAVDEVTLMSGKSAIGLWGVQDVGAVGAIQKLKARSALDNVIGGQPVDCEWKSRSGDQYFAQCLSSNGIDIGLFMIQQGYAVADRAKVFGTPFEEPYVQAEMQAQDQARGVWDEGGVSQGSGSALGEEGTVMISIIFVLFLCMVGAFGFLSLTIMRGFQRVIDAQNDNATLVAAQGRLRDRERGLIASMLESEIKANKSKLEAYIVVYEEILMGLRDDKREPKYKETGDLVQMQPSLERHVFDRNTDKLDLLGNRLSSELIHFYARIKSEPEYQNLEPSMAREEAAALVEKAIEGAQRLNGLAGQLIDSLKVRGMVEAQEQAAEAEAEMNAG